MIINLGLVELGGKNIDGIDISGYMFRFAESDPMASEIRSYYSFRRMLNCEYPDLRVFVNHDSQECLAVAIKLLVEHKHAFEHIYIIFQSGGIMRIK